MERALTKGKMIKQLKEMGVRRNEQDKKLEHCKTFEIIKLYSQECENRGI